MTAFETPPHRLVRATKSCGVIYGFGDASGTGFGSSISIGGKLEWKSGQWNVSIKEESSNYRELLNLVVALEEATSKGKLDSCEIFMFTDNSTAESACCPARPDLFPAVSKVGALGQVRKAMDEDGLVVKGEIHVNRFKFGRAGDHFMTMFQCDLCHFRNIKKS